MFASLRQIFSERIQGSPAEAGDDRRLRIAAAALLLEVVRADDHVTDEERTVMRTGLQGTFGLPREEADDLIRLAEAESREEVSLYGFTSLVDKGLAAEEKKRIVELLWLVAFADSAKSHRGAPGAQDRRAPARAAPRLHRRQAQGTGQEPGVAARRRLSHAAP